MSTTTPNLTLTLYDSTTDQVVTFATFRAVWGGTATTSNFYRIDTWAGTVNSSISTLQNQRGAIPVSASFISANYYEATVASITAYTTGMSIILSVDTTSSGTVTLNINALGTKSLMKVDSTGTPINLTGSDLVDGRQYLFTYDGTRWLWVSANSADQIQIVGSVGNVVTVGSTNNLDGSTSPSSLISSTVHAATEKTSLADSDEIGITDSAASYVLKRITWSNFKTVIGTALGSVINALTGKTTPVGGDVVAIGDSAASYGSKKVSLSNLYKALGTGTQDSTTFLRGDGTYATPVGGLDTVITTVTTSNLTASAGNRYMLDISGLTANRNFVLPAGTAGDEIEVSLTVGDDTYVLILIGDTGISINNGSTATEWSRIFISNETVKFVATSSSNWDVVLDGRKACVGSANRNTAQSINSSTLTKILINNSLVNIGNIVDVTTNNRINIRRTGTYSVKAFMNMANVLDDQEQLQCVIYVDSSLATYANSWVSSGLADRSLAVSLSTVLSLTVGQIVELYVFHTEGAAQNTNTFPPPAISIVEIL